MAQSETIAARFADLAQRRASKLERAYNCAELTIPGLLPREGYSQDCELYLPYSSDGAHATTRLASRITSAHVPLNDISYFQLYIDPIVVGKNDTTEEDKQLERRERWVRRKLATTNLRSALYTAEQHLIVVGDCLWYESDDYEFQVYRLDQYVVRRNPRGREVEIILEEWVILDTLDLDIQDKVKNQPQSHNSRSSEWEPFYTHLLWNQRTKRWDVRKEFRETIVESGKTFEVSPYIPLLWTHVAGEDYGRSLCEENIGALRTVESLTRSFIESAAANAEWRCLVDPNGTTEVEDFENSENGDYIPGRQEDVYFAQLGSPIHLETTSASLREAKRDLAKAFLLTSATRRDAERVTAEEIRADAQDLDHGLGGVLSTQSNDLMPRTLERSILLMKKEGLFDTEIDVGDSGPVKIKIRTGLEALGRQIDNAKLAQLNQLALQNEEFGKTVNWSEFGKRWTTANGIESDNLIFSQEQLQEMAAAAQQQELVAAGGQEAINTAGQIAQESAKGT